MGDIDIRQISTAINRKVDRNGPKWTEMNKH